MRAGNDSGEVAFLAFSPGVRSVKAGEAVTFADGEGLDGDAQRRLRPAGRARGDGRQASSPRTPPGIGYDPLSVYASDPGDLVVDGANHGNGFANTGLLDDDKRTPFPARAKVTFATPGSYGFICTVHGPSMKGTIAVS